MKKIVIFTALSCLSLAACSSNKRVSPETLAIQKERPAEQIYQEAMTAYKNEEYVKAGKLFDEVERQHPYSDYATMAQLKAAESAYENLRYDEALIALDRFIELHPGHEKIDYAYYMKAMCYYEQITDVARDQQMTRNALDALNVVIERFPDSQYRRDAELKRDLTMDHLAGKEMEIGRYYQKRGEINSAIGRFTTVIKNYQTTTHVPEALHRLVESYTTLGLKDEATRVAAVLAYNYPGSRWYQDTYDILDPGQRAKLKNKEGFLDRTIGSLLK